MKFINAEHTLWQDDNRSGTIEDPYYVEHIANGGVTADYIAPEDGPYHLYKSKFIERMTPEEATTFEIKLNAHDLAKLRLMYHAVEYFVSDDPLFAVLHWELVQEFGEARADQLLGEP